MALYRAISAHSSTVVSLEDTVSGKAPASTPPDDIYLIIS